jgi:hypothetical protein
MNDQFYALNFRESPARVTLLSSLFLSVRRDCFLAATDSFRRSSLINVRTVTKMSLGLKLGVRGVCSDDKRSMTDYVLPKVQARAVSRFAMPLRSQPLVSGDPAPSIGARFAALAEKFDGIITTTLKALWTDLSDPSKMDSAENNILAVAVAVLKVLRGRSDHQLASLRCVNVAVPTTPLQQPAFEAACRLAVSLAMAQVGLDPSTVTLRLLPSACCDVMGVTALVQRLYERSESDTPMIVMVVDVGSLLTAASVVKCCDAVLPELIATQADMLGCGGDAIDQALLYSFLAQNQDAFIAQPLTATSKQMLMHKMRAAKEATFPPGVGSPRNRSLRRTVDHDIGGGHTVSFTVTEEAVNEVASDTIFRKIGALCSSVISLAANSHKLLEIAGQNLVVDAVVVTGGCSNIPLLRKFVEDLMVAMAVQAGSSASCLRGGVHASHDCTATGASMISATCRSLMRGPFFPPAVSSPVCASTLLIALHGDCWGVLLDAGAAYPAVCSKRLCLLERTSRTGRTTGGDLHAAVRLMAVSSDQKEVVADNIEPIFIQVPQQTGSSSGEPLFVDLLLVLDASGTISLSVSHTASGITASSTLGPFSALAARSGE